MEALNTAAKIPTASPASHHQNKPDVNAKEDAIKMHPPVFYQAKLMVGAPDDPLEKEADDMADKVMRMPMPEAFNSLSFGEGRGEVVNRKCAECEAEEKLNRKESSSETTSVAPPIVHDVLNSSGGKSLDVGTRSFMEPRFNYDFSNVKIHDNDLAAKSAGSINALAYTSGNNVVFNSGQYNTNSDSGKRLLAHELTHVVQQGDGVAAKIQRIGDLTKVPPMVCDVANTSPAGTAALTALFPTSSTALSPSQKTDIATFVASWRASGGTDNLRVDGYASTLGRDEVNWRLSCDRAFSVANELDLNGVPRTMVEFFAQGETDEFGGQLDNQRANITILAAAPIPTPPTPTPPIKNITVDFVRLHGSTISPATEMSAANTIFSSCNINFINGAMPPIESLTTTQSWLGGDTDVNASGITCPATTAEEKKMYDDATIAHGLSGRMRVFLVDTFSGYGAAGFSRPPYCDGGGYANHVILANIASTATNPLAHEFGHILQNNGVHSTSPNLMAPSGGTVLDATQCATCYANA